MNGYLIEGASGFSSQEIREMESVLSESVVFEKGVQENAEKAGGYPLLVLKPVAYAEDEQIDEGIADVVHWTFEHDPYCAEKNIVSSTIAYIEREAAHTVKPMTVEPHICSVALFGGDICETANGDIVLICHKPEEGYYIEKYKAFDSKGNNLIVQGALRYNRFPEEELPLRLIGNIRENSELLK